LEESPESVVSIFSLSKSYAMTGWRAGYAIGDERAIRKMNRFLENTMSCFPQFIQTASAYALEKCDRYIAKFREELRKRRKILEELMQDIPALEFRRTEGAFYSFPKFDLPTGSVELGRGLLDRYNVAVIPGAFFGPSGEGHLRISFAGTPKTIEGGMKRLRTSFERLVTRSS
jgi:aspartate/methionine/tyrosine aminotransferase